MEATVVRAAVSGDRACAALICVAALALYPLPVALGLALAFGGALWALSGLIRAGRPDGYFFQFALILVIAVPLARYLWPYGCAIPFALAYAWITPEVLAHFGI